MENKHSPEEKVNPLVAIKSVIDGFEVEYEILPVVANPSNQDERQQRIDNGLAEVDDQLTALNDQLTMLNNDIERLTNQADGLDYSLAVTCGVIAGIIDSVFVGEWDFKKAKKEAYSEINSKVAEFAKKQPDYIPFCNNALEGKGGPRLKPKDPNRLATAVEFLEWKYHLPGDGAYKGGHFGIGAETHRLDDLCHHPTIVGLVCCVIVQFTESTLYVNSSGKDVNLPIAVNEYGKFVGSNAITKLFSGVINWFVECAKTIANRKGHLMSDVATPAGVPGSLLSLITELASIPCFRDDSFLTELRRAYTKGFGTGKGQIDLGVFNSLFDGAKSNFDISTEKAIEHELKRQAIPVIINEILVRGVYFIRRFILELKDKHGFNDFEWNKMIPLRNRTIVRMMTISTGTFTAVDMADAAIRSACKSVDTATFFSNLVLRINFVGVGRFTIAVATDTVMGISKASKRNEIIKLQNQQIRLLGAKMFYRQAEMWIAAESAEKTIEEAYCLMEKATMVYIESANNIRQSMEDIGKRGSSIEEKNPGLISKIEDTLKWG